MILKLEDFYSKKLICVYEIILLSDIFFLIQFSIPVGNNKIEQFRLNIQKLLLVDLSQYHVTFSRIPFAIPTLKARNVCSVDRKTTSRTSVPWDRRLRSRCSSTTWYYYFVYFFLDLPWTALQWHTTARRKRANICIGREFLRKTKSQTRWN